MRNYKTDVRQVLSELHKNAVDFVIVGGVALIANGSKRTTRDFDICYERSMDNLVRLNRALLPLNPKLRGAPVGFPFVLNPLTLYHGLNFALTTTMGSLDLLGEVAGVGTYADAAKDARYINLIGTPTKVLSLNSLERAKRAAGRVKDWIDIAEILQIRSRQFASNSAIKPIG